MITKEKWGELIKDFHSKKLPETYSREINIPLEKPINRAISIIGPRRAGKTYIMFNLIKKLLKKYKKESVLYLNFERAGLRPLNSNDLVSMKEVFFEITPSLKKEESWFFLDEIQNVENWEIFVRTCLDEGINIFISGSSSKMLSRDIATSMRGRTLTYKTFPFSFREFLEINKIKKEKYLSSEQKSVIVNLFDKYLNSGGYPEVLIYPEQSEKILTDIFETALYKDVIEREKIRNSGVIRHLINALINSKEFSSNKFYNFLKSRNVKASKDSIYNYVRYLNDAFVIFPVKKFDLSYKKSEQSLPKIYFIDNGLLTNNAIDDKGRLLENLVFLDLLRRGKNISYYKTSSGEEVDFVIREGKKVLQLIQVCYDLRDFVTKERELKTLVKSSKEFKCKDVILITRNEEKTENYKGVRIKSVPAWKWLLEYQP